MSTPPLSSFVVQLASLVPLHAGGPSMPVPHWVVLLAAVPALWLLVGGTVLVADRLLQELDV